MNKTVQFDAVVAVPGGRVGLLAENEQLRCAVLLPPEIPEVAPESPFLKEVLAQLRAYGRQPEHRFDVPYVDIGTPFQRRVWTELTTIPAGSVTTYGELAARLGSSARAVGAACRANPLPLIRPCHRVVAATGLGGFSGERSGWLLDFKRALLRHEGRSV